MKNKFISNLENKVAIKIKGKNIERFIKRINLLKIDIFFIKYIKYNEILIKIRKKDLTKIEEVKTIYEIEIEKYYGISEIVNKILRNKIFIISLIISFIILYILCQTIFEVKVIHNDEKLRNIILEELKNYKIEKYKFKKSYKELQNVKNEILRKYKDQIEWLEIEEKGTIYLVRVEQRIKNKKEENYQIRNIVAKKDSRIIKIESSSGEVLKRKNDYVKKGDVVISGNINLYEETKDQVMAEGKVYGEVWYKSIIEYPLHYEEEILTSEKTNKIVFKFINKEIYKKEFKTKKGIDIFSVRHLFMPIKISLEKQIKTNKINENLTFKEAEKKALEKAKEKINSKLKSKEYIIDTKKLKIEKNNSKIILEVFFSVCEDITDYQEIKEIKE